MAGRTGSKDVDNVLWVTVAVLGGDFLGPRLHFAGFNLGSRPTGTTNEVVVVAGRAGSIEVLALNTEGISTSVLRQSVQRSIHSGQTNGGTPVAQFLVQLLRADKLRGCFKSLPDFFSLLCVAFHFYFS